MNDNTTALRDAARCEKKVLENGLVLLVRPMPGFRDVHVMCGTRFGSVDRSFTVNGERVDLPAGVAHFLEHKMFESEQGDAFTQYAAVGASANAFTSFDKTCYLFSTTSGVDHALDILLGLVGHPYFTDETVAKEQGIIGQEIRMYDDSPEWRMMFALLQGLYHAHPARDDIAGTEESIARITPQLLYRCTDAFYAPGNLVLAAAGNITMQQVEDAVRRAGMDGGQIPDVQRHAPAEPPQPAKERQDITMSIAKPFLGVGFKEAPPAPQDRLKTELICDMLGELICGSMTPLFRRLYDGGLASADFGGEFLSVDGALCVLFSGETRQPETVRTMLLEEIGRLRREGVDRTIFTLCKNQMYGQMVCELDSTTGLAGALCSSELKGRSLFDEMQALTALQPEDIDAALQTMLCTERSTTAVIWPEKEEAE